MNRRDFLKLFGALSFVPLATKLLIKDAITKPFADYGKYNDKTLVRVWILTPDDRPPQLLEKHYLKIERPHC